MFLWYERDLQNGKHGQQHAHIPQYELQHQRVDVLASTFSLNGLAPSPLPPASTFSINFLRREHALWFARYPLSRQEPPALSRLSASSLRGKRYASPTTAERHARSFACASTVSRPITDNVGTIWGCRDSRDLAFLGRTMSGQAIGLSIRARTMVLEKRSVFIGQG